MDFVHGVVIWISVETSAEAEARVFLGVVGVGKRVVEIVGHEREEEQVADVRQHHTHWGYTLRRKSKNCVNAQWKKRPR